MNTATYCVYKKGSMSIKDTMSYDENGVLRTTCFGKTLADCVKEDGESYEVMLFDDACKMISELQEEHYIKPFKEIGKAAYMYALEVLPPENWQTVDGVNIFRMSEYTTSNIMAHYARIGDRYFTAERRTTTPYSVIAEQVKACL